MKVRDLGLFAKASLDLIRVDAALRRQGFSDILARLDGMPAQPPPSVMPRDLRNARRYARRIADASRVSLPRVRCLHRSLVLHAWLREAGLPSELKIGVMRDGELLNAHAWIELGGVVVNDQRRAVNAFTSLAGQRFGTMTGRNHSDPAPGAEPLVVIQPHAGQPESRTREATHMGAGS